MVLNINNRKPRGLAPTPLIYHSASGFVGRDSDITLLAAEPNWTRPTIATLRHPMREVLNQNNLKTTQILPGTTPRIEPGKATAGVVGGLIIRGHNSYALWCIDILFY